MKKLLSAIMATAMIFASFASCGGTKTPEGTVSKLQTGEVVNLNAGIRYNNKNELLFLPEDVGEINNYSTVNCSVYHSDVLHGCDQTG